MDPSDIAKTLDAAWTKQSAPIPPLTESYGLEDTEFAYAVQMAWTERRLAGGEGILGRKIGLTSLAMQEQLGVSEPDYGSLWSSRYFPAKDGHAEIPADTFVAPRIEGEIAFLLGEAVSGPEATPEQVLAATEALAPAFEIVDSRIEDWRIKLPDTIADNASYGAFTTGPWDSSLKDSNLGSLPMRVERSGELVGEGEGSAAMGDPALCVAWLANKLHGFGISLQAGDIVLSGALAAAVPVTSGEEFTLHLGEKSPLTVKFTDD
ncbi:2-keto-4-pentenoate hydratase [Rubrobacter aplysinae]|uniref:2-keto-4-pentenoate hydratase n=1 Tax=Rubrobacter aplysinae TaxID=909625 RepID=UPI00064BBC80|nr:fumarylacetoacetate hydrolase family protein [Rubrobacter aplysinae]